MNRVLIVFAHPRMELSKVQTRLLAAAGQVKGVFIHDLYQLYPDFFVDVKKEQQVLLEHDIILLQHPFYWYSCPPLLKQWIDLVLEHGWAYGREGKMLEGKKTGNVISTGGIEAAYQHNGFNRFTIREFLAPFDQTARLCRMEYLPPFVIHGTHRAAPADIQQAAEQYQQVLKILVQGEFPDEKLREANYLQDILRLNN